MRKLICLGDSLTFGLRVPHSQAWPRLISRETGMEVRNLGISGDTTGGMLARLQTITGGVPVAPENMPVLLIMGGSNDIFYAGTDTVAKANIGAMIHQAMAAHMLPVVGITLPFMSAGGSSNLCIYIAMGVVFSVYRVNCDTTPVDFRMVNVRTPYR